MEDLVKNTRFNPEEISKIMKGDMTDALSHGILVSKLATKLSRKLEMPEDFCYAMSEAGMVHDIGKLKLSKYLYGRKENALEIEEIKYVRMHSTFSYNILKEYDYEEWVLQAIYHHHENYDGSGYPDNLTGEEIPFAARILRTCDVFAALISIRPYRKAFDMDTAMELMIDEVKNFDMKIFLAFLELVNSPDFDGIKMIIKETNDKKRAYEKELNKEK